MTGYIYKISISKHYYYGQTTDAERRRGEHLYALKRGDHANRYIQAAWDKYLKFEFEIIEEVSEDLLDEREQYYIDKYIDDVNCMNLAKYVDSPMRGRKHSAEARAKLSAAHNTPCLGRPVGTTEWTEFPSQTAAAAHVSGDHRHVSKCILGKARTHKGWEFRSL